MCKRVINIRVQAHTAFHEKDLKRVYSTANDASRFSYYLYHGCSKNVLCESRAIEIFYLIFVKICRTRGKE